MGVHVVILDFGVLCVKSLRFLVYSVNPLQMSTHGIDS